MGAPFGIYYLVSARRKIDQKITLPDTRARRQRRNMHADMAPAGVRHVRGRGLFLALALALLPSPTVASLKLSELAGLDLRGHVLLLRHALAPGPATAAACTHTCATGATPSTLPRCRADFCRAPSAPSLPLLHPTASPHCRTPLPQAAATRLASTSTTARRSATWAAAAARKRPRSDPTSAS